MLGRHANIRIPCLILKWNFKNWKLKVDSWKCCSYSYLFNDNLVVLTMRIRRWRISLHSTMIWSKCSSLIKLLSFRSIIQYSVSFASFKAMFILCRKSALDWACSASLIRAPIAVPLQSNCFDKTNSLLLSKRNLYVFITFNANEYDFVETIPIYFWQRCLFNLYQIELIDFFFEFRTSLECP